MREDNLSYFEKRLAQEEDAAVRAADALTASIHRELAEEYRVLIEAERRLIPPPRKSVLEFEILPEPARR